VELVISDTSTPEDVQQWLKENHFADFMALFSKYNGCVVPHCAVEQKFSSFFAPFFCH